MKNPDKEQYGVKYSGKLLDGFTIKEAVILLQKNGKMNVESIKRLLSLRDSFIKKDIPLETANNLVKILRGCGLDCSCTPMQQNRPVIEQNQPETITDMIMRMSNEDLCNAILSLGNQRAKEIAFAVIKETTKDSFDSLKENAEEKLSSLAILSSTQFKFEKLVQTLKKVLTKKRIIGVGAVLLFLMIWSYFFRSSNESDIRVTPPIVHDSQPHGNERYDTNQLSRIK